MKRYLILAMLAVAGAPAHAQDAATCAALQTQYENEFKLAVVKAIGTLDRKERCEIGRGAMTILDKLAAAADNCPVQPIHAPPADATGQVTEQVTGLARMKLINDGESIREMVMRRKASFARACGNK
jgi:hypothetical protein